MVFDAGATSPSSRLCAIGCEMDEGAAPATDAFPVCCGAYAVAFANFGVGVDTLLRLNAAAAGDPKGACAVECDAGVNNALLELYALGKPDGILSGLARLCIVWFDACVNTLLALDVARRPDDVGTGPSRIRAIEFDTGVGTLLALCAAREADSEGVTDTLPVFCGACAVEFANFGVGAKTLLELYAPMAAAGAETFPEFCDACTTIAPSPVVDFEAGVITLLVLYTITRVDDAAGTDTFPVFCDTYAVEFANIGASVDDLLELNAAGEADSTGVDVFPGFCDACAETPPSPAVVFDAGVITLLELCTATEAGGADADVFSGLGNGGVSTNGLCDACTDPCAVGCGEPGVMSKSGDTEDASISPTLCAVEFDEVGVALP